MPVQSCEINGKPGYRWGEQGKCYPYMPGNEGSRRNAKKSAIAQGLAIGDMELMKGDRISFDYDGVLSTDKGKELAKKEIESGSIVYIISARRSVENLYPVAKELGIPKNRVYAVGSNNNKIEQILRLKIMKHWDNNPDVVKGLINVGKLFN